jgi:Kef-type K+ transport system membrane component KefB
MDTTSSSSTPRVIIVYGLTLVAAVALFFIFRAFGETLVAPPAQASLTVNPVAGDTSNILWHLLLALVAVVALGRLLGALFHSIGQPPVIGEVVAGILLGPSLLGHIAPEAAAYILPGAVAPYLGLFAQLAVIVYMFTVGLDLNTDLLRGQVRPAVATSHSSILVPFTMGSALALYLYPRFSTSAVPFTHFALFLGVAMSITAFPVLARILSDQGMTRTRLGALALTCAAVDDITAWCLLAFVVGVVHDSGGHAALSAVWTIGFIVLMFTVVRPLLERLSRHIEAGASPEGPIAMTLVGMLLAALATDAIGVHAIFGAFMLGAVIRHDSALARALKRAVGDLVIILLLPAFFAFTGMRTEVGLVSGVYEWLVCGLIILVATAGKFGGTLVAARATGLDTRHAAGLGVLMNTRGLMELIVLNVGLDLGVISPTLFTMLVLMAIVTTMMTTPLLHVVFPAQLWKAAPASAVAHEARTR